MDDNPTVCRVLAEQAAQWGMNPRAAESAAQALDWLRAGEPFDLAVVDLQMPGMDGMALAAEIRKLPGAAMMPLIFLTPLGARGEGGAGHAGRFCPQPHQARQAAQFHAAIERALFSKTKTAAPAPPKPDQPLAERLPLRILLCEDNEINQKVAARILQQLGYACDLAVNGREALEALDNQHYDLVFMDMMMPEMDGLAATRAIRERQKDAAAHPNYQSRILIIAMTAHAQQSDREKCLAAGMDDYLAKPIRPGDVRGVIEKWAPQIPAAAAKEPAKAAAPVAAAAPASVSPPARAAGAAAPAPVSPPARAADGPPPVEMTRLADLTEGSPDSMRELIEMFYKQTAQQLRQIEEAVRANKAPDIGHVAHSCKGASATLGMTPTGGGAAQTGKAGQIGRPCRRRGILRRGPARIQGHPGVPRRSIPPWPQSVPA